MSENANNAKRSGNPLLNLFSSVWLGVTLLLILFIYASIGSAYPPLRQIRGLELTEFEWFHWWPFNLLIALICINITVATLRRIPFKPINYGVWMIHVGILILCAGSVWYFGTKIEGQAFVARRQLTVQLNGAEPITMPARRGEERSVAFVNKEGQTDVCRIQVLDIDPQWEILKPEHKGEIDYKVTVRFTDSDQTFMRNVLARFPDYTEDMLRTNDPEQPFQRSIKAIGQQLVDDTIVATLDCKPTSEIYINASTAIYVREINDDGPGPWFERPVEKMVRYQDYITDVNNVWPTVDNTPLDIDPLEHAVPAAEEGDPLNGPLTIRDYLRHAQLISRPAAGGTALDPVIDVVLQDGNSGQVASYTMVAFDQARRTAEGGRLAFRWFTNEQDVQQYLAVTTPELHVSIPDQGIEQRIDIEQISSVDPDTPFIDIGESGYSVRIDALNDDLLIREQLVSIASITIRKPDGTTFKRMANLDVTQSMDFEEDGAAHDASPETMTTDQSIQTSYVKANRPAGVTVVGGPADDQLRLIVSITGREMSTRPMAANEPIVIDGSISLTVNSLIARPTVETRPLITPMNQRSPQSGQHFSLLRVAIPDGEGHQAAWLEHHDYLFESAGEALYPFRFNPTPIALSDGRRLELLYCRQRHKLEAPVVLDDFVITAHAGGFSDQQGSIRDWTSIIRFDEGGQLGERMPISVNQPVEHSGFWFFQSGWDKPNANDQHSGLAFTILGVGNRNGVMVQLIGCCISVIGMLYAFYYKPIIRRRQQKEVYNKVRAGKEAMQQEEAAVEHVQTCEGVAS